MVKLLGSTLIIEVKKSDTSIIGGKSLSRSISAGVGIDINQRLFIEIMKKTK